METQDKKEVPVILSHRQLKALEDAGVDKDILLKLRGDRQEEMKRCKTLSTHPVDAFQFEFGEDRIMTVVETQSVPKRKEEGGFEEIETLYYCHEIRRGSNNLLCLVLHYIADKKLGRNSSALVNGIARAFELDKETTNLEHF